VQHPQQAGLEVLAPVRRGPQRPVGEVDRERVHREVAAQEVLLDAGRPHLRQRAGTLVALSAGHGDVHDAVGEPDARGAEALVPARLAAERAHEGSGIALDHDVELAGALAAQEVAHGAADEVGAGDRRAQQLGAARQEAQAVAEIWHVGHTIYHLDAMSPTPRRKKRLWWLVAGVAVLLLLAGAAVAVMRTGQGDVSNPDVAFEETTESVPAAPDPSLLEEEDDDDAAPRHPSDDGFSWAHYGYTKSRTHYLPVRRTLRPPFRPAWSATGRVLLEFTPVLCGRRLFLLKNNGALYAISRLDGRVAWKRKLGSLAASSPACGDGTVYVTLLERFRRAGGGRVAAIDAIDGRTRWSRKLPSRSESSPLLDSGRLYFGTEDGTVYALRASDGAIRWRTRASGAVKGAVALADGKLFFGDYGGKVHAIRQRDGGKVWTSGTGSVLGLRSGNFYSSPAVAYGRVYIGSTSGAVYSFSARNGDLAWRHATGGFVYASPAVGPGPGGAPTVFVGSYDGRFYALDARSGRSRWTRHLGTKISGAATLIGDLVFVSDLKARASWALGAGTGATVWKTGRGGFNPAISDGRRIYFNGYSSLFALDPAGIRYDTRKRRERRSRRDR
jgi:outer membrane protein assembly factor BamB